MDLFVIFQILLKYINKNKENFKKLDNLNLIMNLLMYIIIYNLD
jgi:hypothetical protein